MSSPFEPPLEPSPSLVAIQPPKVKIKPAIAAEAIEHAKRNRIAHFVTTDEDGLPLEESKYQWVGDATHPIFLGYPYVTKDDQGLPVVPPLGGFELLPVQYDPETHCVIYVRADAYKGVK